MRRTQKLCTNLRAVGPESRFVSDQLLWTSRPHTVLRSCLHRVNQSNSCCNFPDLHPPRHFLAIGADRKHFCTSYRNIESETMRAPTRTIKTTTPLLQALMPIHKGQSSWSAGNSFWIVSLTRILLWKLQAADGGKGLIHHSVAVPPN